MKIILSPTKSMKRKSLLISETQAPFLKESEKLRECLKKKSKTALKTLYKASDKVVDTAYQYYQEENESIQALALYDGLVFKQLELTSYNKEELAYLEHNVFIMSALYGALRVSDMIKEYRLDYLMNFDFNLYEYWKEPLSNYFKDEALIVNLASSEFSKSFEHENMINIHFVNKEGKTQSTAAKMARGDMLNYLVKNNILDLEGIKKYNNLRYQFDETRSSDKDLYFVMEEV